MKKYSPTGSVAQFLLAGAALVVLLAGLKAATPILLPFLLALFIAIIANPAVVQLMRWRIPRALAIWLILIFIIVLILAFAGVVGSSIRGFQQSIPQYRSQLLNHLAWLTHLASYLDIHISKETISSYFDPGVIFGVFANTLSGLSSMATDFFIILVTTIFMLFEADSLPKRLYRDGGVDHHNSPFYRFSRSVNHYMGVKTLVSLITAVPITLVLWGLHLDYAILWGILAFLLNFIPNVGSLLAAVPAVLLAIVQLGTSDALAVAFTYLVVNLLVGNVIEPRMMGRGLGLSSLVVILSLIFWGWLFGSVGMLLSVPLTMVVKIALESSPDGQRFARWLSHPDELDAGH
ncbi:AI-2E family transporter [Celerinatantimonas yamalensis]|uniref:AI-2E family transporter n=1 Tax=Celerinatantimonas yamalensis TaxID=559956 RepID=A0ABW9G7Q5_9GAMM